MKTLTTQRLILTPFTDLNELNVSEITAYMQDPDVHKYIPGIPDPYTEEHAKAYVEQTKKSIRRQEKQAWGIHRNETLIGTVEIDHISTQNLSAHLGYLLKKQCWGNGYMTEALQAVLNHAFQSLHRVTTEISTENQRSIALVERLGFKQEGVKRDALLLQNKYHDAAIHGMLKQDWT